jgi:lysine 2,3-aminomutase
MIPNAEHWRVPVWRAQQLQHDIMGYLPGYATPRIVCDVPYVGKRWVHMVTGYDRDKGVSYWTKNYRTSIESADAEALGRQHPYYDPIDTLCESGREWWARQTDGQWPAPRQAAPDERGGDAAVAASATAAA